MARLYSPEFAGTRLGLLTRELADEKDGVRHFGRSPTAPRPTRAAAIAEWRAYRDSFASVEEAGLHIDRWKTWAGSQLVATVPLRGHRHADGRAARRASTGRASA